MRTARVTSFRQNQFHPADTATQGGIKAEQRKKNKMTQKIQTPPSVAKTTEAETAPAISTSTTPPIKVDEDVPNGSEVKTSMAERSEEEVSLSDVFANASHAQIVLSEQPLHASLSPVSADQEVEPDPEVVKRKAARIAKILKEEEEALKKPLSQDELSDRARLISVARNGMDSARLAEMALREIRDRRLWRDTHKSFELFCRDEFDLSEQRVSQILAFADEVAQLHGKISEDLIPVTERGIRALRRVKRDQKIMVLQLAAEISNGARPNSTSIEAARLQIEGVKQEEEKSGTPKADAALKAARLLKEFISNSDLDDLKVSEIKELRETISTITEVAAKLAA